MELGEFANFVKIPERKRQEKHGLRYWSMNYVTEAQDRRFFYNVFWMVGCKRRN